MKTTLLFLAMVITTGLFAQTNVIGGGFTKSDETRIKPATKMIFIKGIDDNIPIISYSGGTDNSATIEIEVPTGSYVAEFRNMMNISPANEFTTSQKTKSITPVTAIQDIKRSTVTQSIQSQQYRIARAEITVVNKNSANVPQWVSAIILEDIKVESCTDDVASGKSKIKLKGSRIGWIYYTYDKQGLRSSTQSGWNTVTGQAWNNF